MKPILQAYPLTLECVVLEVQLTTLTCPFHRLNIPGELEHKTGDGRGGGRGWGWQGMARSMALCRGQWELLKWELF